MLGELLVLYHEQLLGLAASPPSSEQGGPLTDESQASRSHRDQNGESGAGIDINHGASNEQANKTLFG